MIDGFQQSKACTVFDDIERLIQSSLLGPEVQSDKFLSIKLAARRSG